MDKEEIHKRLEAVEYGLRELKEAVDKLTVVCSRMNNHISFVEETYDKMKHPLNYMVAGVSMMAGSIPNLLGN